ncbi:MAG: hypothetical protein KBD31_03430 [Proteobacteria bacterium]|nr:hypothetical protein [Pseudomonadota bacterium]
MKKISICFVFLNLLCQSAFSMNQEIALNRCKRELDLYKNLERYEKKDVLLTLKEMVLKTINKLQKAEIQDVPDMLDQCLRGVEAIQWIVDQDNMRTIKDSMPDVKRKEQVDEKDAS